MGIKRARDEHESSSCSSQFTYDVFLSFRGEDTRKTFTDHLYTALMNSGLSTFRDDEEIQRGNNIKSELKEAVARSRSSIIVFSEDYASSSWCLDELVLILHQMKTRGHKVVPVFYDVDPTNIRRQTGSVKEAFTRHEERFKNEVDDTRRKEWMNKVRGWRDALKEAADLSGMVLRNEADGYESKFIKKVVSFIEKLVTRNVIHITPHLVGIGDRVENINQWLRDGSSTDVGIAAICGMGGVGKTTIAKYVYNMNCDRFPFKSFLEHIRENSQQRDGLLCLQRQLLSDMGQTKEINSVNDGVMKIKTAISRGRVLIALDDVDHTSQIEAIFGMRECFYPGSKIIITTKNMQLLKSHEPCRMYAVQEMNSSESLELFSWHAFGDEKPDECYLKQSGKIVRHCQGLPLALQVLGSSLRGKSLDVWRSTTEKLLVSSTYTDIQKILKISYDSLEDDDDRNLLLDIACFFSGKKKSFVIGVMDECGYHTVVGIENLVDRCLLSVDVDDRLRVHQMVQLMAKEIIRQQSPREPGHRSRLWYYKDSFKVLKEEIGTETIEGLALNMSMLREDKSSMRSLNIHNEGHAILKTAAFSRMPKLKLLLINYVQLIGGYTDFPRSLRWLSWHGFPLRSLPKEFPFLESLVAIDMQYSKLTRFWHGKKSLGLLKFLNLSHCHHLLKSPDFSKLPALENLVLQNCVCIIEIDESIGMAEGLLYLNLGDCKRLKKLPRNIGMLKFLEILIISGCSNLDTLPTKEIIKMESLKVLHADGIPLRPESSTSREITSWREFIWFKVAPLRKYPQLHWSSLPHSLVSLSFDGCNLSDNDFPRSFGSITSLQYLDLSRNPIRFLPDCFKGLTRINQLRLYNCTSLQALATVPSVEKFQVRDCPLLEEITFEQRKNFRCYDYPWGCKKLVEFDKCFKLELIENIDVEILNSLGIHELVESLKSIQITFRNHYTITEEKGPIQGVYEIGEGGKLFGIFFLGDRVPSWFTAKSIGSSMSFIVPSAHTAKIQCLNICFVYKSIVRQTKSGIKNFSYNMHMVVHNKTKDMKFVYHPSCHGIPDIETGEFMLWLSQWKFSSRELEAGDEMIVSELTIGDAYFEVNEVGIHLVYYDDNQAQNARFQYNEHDYCTQNTTSAEHLRLIGHNGTTPIYLIGYCCTSFSRLTNYVHNNQQEAEKYKRNLIAMEEESSVIPKGKTCDCIIPGFS